MVLVNTDDPRTGIDGLDGVPALRRFVADRQITGSFAGSVAELHAVRRLRARLRTIFELARNSAGDGVVDALNGMIADNGAVPRLVTHDGLPLHLHYTPAEARLDRRLGAEMAVALAIVVRDGGIERLRICESPGCGRVLIDLSKNRSRRYCDTQCGNRQHVAAYRRRQAASR